MGEAIKLQETDIEETIKSEEKEMEKAINLEETDMEETINPKEKDMGKTTNLMEENVHKNDDTRQKDTLIEEDFSSDFNPFQDPDDDNPFQDPNVELERVDLDEPIKLKDDNIKETIKTEEKGMQNQENTKDKIEEIQVGAAKNENKNGSDELIETGMKIINFLKEHLKEEEVDNAVFYYSLPKESSPYQWELDPGVPAPLRREWKDIDENVRHKYWGVKKCYLDNEEFDLNKFIELSKEKDEKTRKIFSDLAKENKEIAIRELERCYEKTGDFNYIKFDALLEEERKYLKKRIKATLENLIDLTTRLKENRNNDMEVKGRLGYQSHQIKLKDLLEDEHMTGVAKYNRHNYISI